MALYVLVQRNGTWWLAGAQNTPLHRVTRLTASLSLATWPGDGSSLLPELDDAVDDVERRFVHQLVHRGRADEQALQGLVAFAWDLHGDYQSRLRDTTTGLACEIHGVRYSQ
jgi:hypothetical protein